MIPPKPVQKLLAEYPWLDYIPIFKTAKWTKIAELYEAAGDNATDRNLAIEYYLESSLYYENVNSLYRSAILRMKAAQTHKDLMYLDNSNMEYLNASDIFKDIGKMDCYIVCIGKIAENFWLMGEYECAIKHYEICVKTNVYLGKEQANIDYLDCIGTIWSVHMGKYNLAITIYDQLVKMTGSHHFMYILGLLCILAGKGVGIYDKKFIDSYYGEYLILLANQPLKAVQLFDVYKDLIGQCVLHDILHKKISEAVV